VRTSKPSIKLVRKVIPFLSFIVSNMAALKHFRNMYQGNKGVEGARSNSEPAVDDVSADARGDIPTVLVADASAWTTRTPIKHKIKSTIFWNITLYSPIKVNLRFAGEKNASIFKVEK
jgi:hypothetical protein